MVLYAEASDEDKNCYDGKEGFKKTELYRALVKSNKNEADFQEVLGLIDSKPNLINLASQKTQQTPLHACFLAENSTHCIEIATKLIESGAEINAQDKNGNSPLHLAIKTQNYDLASLMVEKGGDIDILNKTDKSPRELLQENLEELNRNHSDYLTPMEFNALRDKLVELNRTPPKTILPSPTDKQKNVNSTSSLISSPSITGKKYTGINR